MKKILKHFFVLFICTYIYSVDEELILSQEFPDKLSDFRFFKDASAQVPHDKVIPYELISTLFSDYSYKQRWVYVPNEKKAEYQEDWVFNFPTGSALIKTFYYPIDERNPELGKNPVSYTHLTLPTICSV